jgi:salicylate hydroxylase
VLSLGIAGAGIGGLTLALACRAAGLEDVTVYERASELEPLGAGLQLSPNASRVLCALGLRAALEAICFHPQGVHLRTWRTSYLVAQRPLGQFSEARYGAPYYHVHRGDLHQLLLRAAMERGVRIEMGQACRGAGEDSVSPWLEFDQGRRRHGAVVGSDGIHSAVRESLFGAAAPRFTGHVAWRGMVATSDLPANLVSPNATVWLGPGRHFVHYYVRRGELINFVGVVETDRWTEESWRQRGAVEDLAADFAGWHPVVRMIIEAADEVYRWALYDREPLTTWSRGNITLLGDACHPMLPYLAQGAAMAIEDAWVLARMLERWEDEPARGIADYQRYRLPRTARVQRSSRLQGTEFHLREPWAVLQRNLKLVLGSRFLPEIAMQQFDWLHGYDCIRGFD